ncbi:MAG: hypothetical protein AAF236_02205 [Verrucomicrobiota bacterium]
MDPSPQIIRYLHAGITEATQGVPFFRGVDWSMTSGTEKLSRPYAAITADDSRESPDSSSKWELPIVIRLTQDRCLESPETPPESDDAIHAARELEFGSRVLTLIQDLLFSRCKAGERLQFGPLPAIDGLPHSPFSWWLIDIGERSYRRLVDETLTDAFEAEVRFTLTLTRSA